MNTLAAVLLIAAVGITVDSFFRYGWELSFADVASLTLVTAGNAVLHLWVLMAVSGFILAWVVLVWWRRRKRRRAPRTIGAKARARIAAMTDRMRERPARPVLRPVPGGPA